MKTKILGLLLGTLITTNAFGTVIDFTVFASGNSGSTTLVTPEATFNSFDSNFFVGAAGQASEICALSASGNCEADFEVIFSSDVNNLTLVTSGFNSGDTVEIFAYDLSDFLLGSVTQAANGLVDLSAFSGISRLFFDDSSTGAGFAYDAFTFDYADVDTGSTGVSEPSLLSLLMLGIAGVGLSRRKMKA